MYNWELFSLHPVLLPDNSLEQSLQQQQLNRCFSHAPRLRLVLSGLHVSILSFQTLLMLNYQFEKYLAHTLVLYYSWINLLISRNTFYSAECYCHQRRQYWRWLCWGWWCFRKLINCIHSTLDTTINDQIKGKSHPMNSQYYQVLFSETS